MRNLCATFLLTLGLLAFATNLPADIPPNPNPGPEPELGPEPEPVAGPFLSVTVDFEKDRSVLLVPKRCLGQNDSSQKNSSISTPRTIVAGLAMSLAIGGVFFLKRNRSLGTPAAVAMVAGLMTLGVAGYAWANAVPPDFLPLQPGPLTLGEISVDVQVVEEGETIQLILTQQDMRLLVQDPAETAPSDRPPQPSRSAPPSPPKSSPPRQ